MGSPFQDLMSAQRSTPGTHIGDQGLSPPYSNQSPPHSVQSNIALSPQGYIGKSPYGVTVFFFHSQNLSFPFHAGSPSPAKTRPSLPTSPTHIQAMRHATQQKHGQQSHMVPANSSQQTMNSVQQNQQQQQQTVRSVVRIKRRVIF